MRVMGTRVLILYYYEFLSSRGMASGRTRNGERTNEDDERTRGEEERGGKEVW
jgi:hypothetical protein